MTIRSLIFWLHLTAGVVAGTVVLVMSVTGVLLTYEKQMVAWAERSPLAVPPTPDAQRLPVERLMAQVREARPSATPASLTFRANRDEPVSVALGRDGQISSTPTQERSSARARPACARFSARSPTGIDGLPPPANIGPRAARSPAPPTSRFSCW